MGVVFLLKAFFTGFCAASAVGPVFIMTFNRSALHGMHLGIATALGAAVTDGFLFFGHVWDFGKNNAWLLHAYFIGYSWFDCFIWFELALLEYRPRCL